MSHVALVASVASETDMLRDLRPRGFSRCGRFLLRDRAARCATALHSPAAFIARAPLPRSRPIPIPAHLARARPGRRTGRDVIAAPAIWPERAPGEWCGGASLTRFAVTGHGLRKMRAAAGTD